MSVMYSMGKGLAKVCFSSCARWEVHGVEAVPPWGRLLVVANHQSNADPPVVAASLPRRLSFLGKQELFNIPVLSTLMRAWGVYPMQRNGQDLKALRWILRTLEREQALVVFPEGTRTRDGMRKANNGIAFVALKANTPILPIGITGTENLQSLWRIPFPFCHIKVNIGQPFSLPQIEGRVEHAVLDSLTDMIMERVAALLPKEYRGVYDRVASRSDT